MLLVTSLSNRLAENDKFYFFLLFSKDETRKGSMLLVTFFPNHTAYTALSVVQAWITLERVGVYIVPGWLVECDQ